ncbi:MAG TPA: FISUMP domain-containing protein [Lentimicrobium sp.]|nr:FISUMP domain-containing protein [Lentimicrobium sp.]
MKKIAGLLLSVIIFTSVTLTRCYLEDGDPTDSFPDRPDRLYTSEVTSVTMTTAVSGGSSFWGGRALVTAKGVCWSTSTNPGFVIGKTYDGSGTGSFTSKITGLSCNTEYYVWAYSINRYGAAHGRKILFTTAPEVPLVTSDPIINYTDISAKTEGRVTSGGLTAITERGFFWGKSPNPELTGTKVLVGADTGIFSTTLTGLNPGTKYYIKAFATNSLGTNFGEQISFTTRTGKITDIDGNIYYTQTIGNQLWMAENLKTTRYADGSPIQLVNTKTMWNALSITSKAYCWYDDSIKYKEIYGAIYNWAAAMKVAAGSFSNPSGVQGVCPTGWHLPSNAEWKELETFLGGPNDAPGKMREPGTTHWRSPNSGTTNESGFSALPGGYRVYEGTFGGYDEKIGTVGRWWSATESFPPNYAFNDLAYGYTITLNNTQYFTLGDHKRNGYSVRCIKDK